MIINQNDAISETPDSSELSLAAIGDALYAELVSHNPEHLLVLIEERFDFTSLFLAADGYRLYQTGGRGQPESHAVSALCRALLVKYLYNWSLTKTIEQLQLNLLVRWFVGYGLHEAPMSRATLQRFAAWCAETDLDRTFFSDVLLQIREDHPDEAEKVQAGDTFALHSRARPQSRTELLRTASQRILEQVERELDDAHMPLLKALDRNALFGPEDETREYLLPPKVRTAREEATATAALPLLALARTYAECLPPAALPRLALERHTRLLEKILLDEFVLTMDGQGVAVGATLRDKHVKGAYVIGSVKDPEATFRNHGKRSDLGYNISITATDRFIHETGAATGAEPDSQGIVPLLTRQQEHLESVPPRFLYDQAAGYPKFFAQVEYATKGRTQLVARMVKAGRTGDLFGPLDFTLDDSGRLICPNGQVSSTCYRSRGKDRSGWTYRFTLEQCAGCPIMDMCREKSKKPAKYRQVFITDYLYNQREALAYQATEEFEQDMKRRADIERIIAALVRYNGARRADSYGLRKADFQVRMAATAYNLKRWAELLREEKREKRRQQRERKAEALAYAPDMGNGSGAQASESATERNKGDPVHAPPVG
ncbi:MAG: transposase [Caldilineaceae bacterium]|nr:transposase [Caldilineaceae bacterium]